MKTFKACVAAVLLAVTLVGVADAKSRVSSSRSYSAPKTYSAPKAAPSKPSTYNGSSFFNSKPTAAPKAAPTLNLNKPDTAQSKPTLKLLGFTKPAPVQAVKQPSVSVSSKPLVKAPIAKTTSTSGGFITQKRVSSTPAYKPPARKVVSPVAYRSSPRNVTVVQKNYYGGNSYGGGYGYNRGYGNYHGNSYGHNSGMGSSIVGGALGAFGGMMIYDALTNNSAEQQLQSQLNQLSANQQAMNNNLLLMNQSNNTTSATPVVQKPQCFLPPDAPLMMDPKFYCGGK